MKARTLILSPLRKPAVAVFIVLVAAMGMCFAQYTSGFQGTISDATGAVVPDVQVQAHNVATGVNYPGSANATGAYFITDLPPGTYLITANKSGFATAQVQNVVLRPDELKGVNITLQLSTAQQNVQVTAQSPVLDTEQARVAENVSQQTLSALPLEGENPLTVVQLLPGVTGVTPGATTDIFAVADSAAVNANGLRSSSNNYQIDGTTVTETPNGGTMNIAPALDEIADMQVVTNNFSAQYGRSAGFQLDAVTKSGTNNLHGDAYYDGITAALNANSFFANANPVKNVNTGAAYKPRFDKNLFGASTGGPIIRNKTFFFGSYAGVRQRGGPSEAQGAPSSFVGTAETQTFVSYVKTNFPNSIANTLLQGFPPQSYASSGFITAGQLFGSSQFATASQFPANLPVLGTTTLAFPAIHDGDHYFGRVDHNFSDNDRVYGAFMHTSITSETPETRTAFNIFFPENDAYLGLNEVHIFSPNLLNEFKFGFSRTGSYVPGTHPEIPQISLDDGTPGFGVFSSMPFGFFQMNYEWRDILTKYQGRHNLKLGLTIRRGHDDFESVARPAYEFATILDFALDRPVAETRSVNPVNGQARGSNYEERTREAGAFVQDDFKLDPRLTLNLGLRWDYYGSPTENFHSFANFFPGPGSNFFQSIANGSMEPVSTPWHSQKGLFVPRLGYSWNPLTKLVIRGGFGMNYDRIPNGDWESLANNPPLIATATVGPRNGNTPVVYSLGGTGPDYGFPPNPALATGLDAHNGIAGARVGVTGADANLKYPYAENWFQGIQYQIGANWVAEADYTGGAGHHLAWVVDINRFVGLGSTRFNPSFSSISELQGEGNSNYNALSLQARRRVNKGLLFSAAYTFSKSIDLTSADGGQPLDAYNLRLDRAVSDFNHTHKFVAYATWGLPALSDSPAAARWIAGGWQLNPMLVLQSGAPFNVICGNCDYNNDGNFGNDRPDAPSFGSHIQTGNQVFINGVFNVSNFPAPPSGTDGTLGRNVYTGPGYASLDLGLRKTFAITERVKFEAGADAFNLLNRVNLTGMVSDLASVATFGKATTTYNPREIQLGGKIIF